MKIEDFFQDALDNIQNDRTEAKKLLNSVEEYIEENEGIETTEFGEGSRHKSVGAVASKYIEALQRSNDQLIKLIAVYDKVKSKSEDFDLDDKEFKDKIYSLIESNDEEVA